MRQAAARAAVHGHRPLRTPNPHASGGACPSVLFFKMFCSFFPARMMLVVPSCSPYRPAAFHGHDAKEAPSSRLHNITVALLCASLCMYMACHIPTSADALPTAPYAPFDRLDISTPYNPAVSRATVGARSPGTRHGVYDSIAAHLDCGNAMSSRGLERGPSETDSLEGVRTAELEALGVAVSCQQGARIGACLPHSVSTTPSYGSYR